MVEPAKDVGFSLDDIRDVVFRTDAEGHWTYLNAAWTEVTGFSREESLGCSFLDFVYPGDRRRNLELFAPLIRREKDHCLHEIRYRKKPDGFLWIEVHARLTLAKDGSATGTTGTLRDVTLRREAEAAQRQLQQTEDALQESEARFRAMADGAPVILWMSDPQGGNHFVNRTYLEFFGVRQGELGSDKWRPYLHPEDRADYLASVERGLREETGFVAEARVQRKDGAWRRLACRALPRRSASGAFLGHAGIALDITDRKIAEDALRESEARYRASEETLRLALAAGRLVEWEYDVDQASYILGASSEDVTGVPHSREVPRGDWIRVIHPDDRSLVEAAHQRTLEEGPGRYEAEYRVNNGDGNWRWLRAQGRVTLRDGSGHPKRLTGVVMDVTEVRTLQESLIAATRLASVGTLAAGVAHEINNPLAFVTSNLSYSLDLLSRPAGTGLTPELVEDLRSALDDARQGTIRIAGIVKAMRSLGRPETRVDAQLVDLRGEIQSAIQMVRTQVLQRARLEVDLPRDLPAITAKTNELGRVFLNLLLNAAQAIPEGNPGRNLVTVRARTRDAEVMVEISDSGSGVDPAIKDRIFEPFFTTKPPGVGTGLGLTMVRSILDGVGGRLELSSQPERGSTFRVFLPGASEKPMEPQVEATRTAVSSKGERYRVLIVDDEPLVGRSLQRCLERQHDVTVLTSGTDALRRLQRIEPWDVVLCDFAMPDLDGIALYEEMLAKVPALAQHWAFITGGAVADRTARFLAKHEVLTLYKPVDPLMVLDVVDRLGRGKGVEHRA